MTHPVAPKLTTLFLVCMACCGASLSAQQATANEALAQMLKQGSGAMQKGDWVRAESSFKRALEVAPRSADANFGLGLVQLRQGALDRAVDSLGKAVKLNSKLGGAHMSLGVAEYQSGRAEEALTDLRASFP